MRRRCYLMPALIRGAPVGVQQYYYSSIVVSCAGKYPWVTTAATATIARVLDRLLWSSLCAVGGAVLVRTHGDLG